MVLGTLAFGIGLAVAVPLYARGPSRAATGLARAFPAGYRLLRNKYYVDEIYDFLIVRPLRFSAHALAQVFDRFLIDTVLVRGSARLVDGVGTLLRWLQNGDVQRYVAVMIVGAAALVWFAARPPTNFTVRSDGDRVIVSALPSAHGARQLRYCWRIDGGGCESDKREDALPLPPGRHKLTLEVADEDWGASASRSVEVQR
jgi:NADH-quinone oxidoreductase subunit L